MALTSKTTTIASPAHKIVFKDNYLKLCCNLQRADYAPFQVACEKLGKSPAQQVTLDLTMCTYISSLIIGILVDSVTTMKAAGKDVQVRVSPEVGRFLHMAHLYHLFNYEIVQPNLEAK